MKEGRHLLYAVFAGFGGALAIILVVFLTGSTFGQRCAFYYPDASALELDQCVEHLRTGKPISDLPTPKDT